MTKYAGRLMLIQVGTGSPLVYNSVGGVRTNSMTLNNSAVDVTDKLGAPWKELLIGAGVQSMAMKGQGVASSDLEFKALKAAAVANTPLSLKLIDGSGDTFTATFQITSFEQSGEYSKEQTFSISLESSGVVTYTPGA